MKNSNFSQSQVKQIYKSLCKISRVSLKRGPDGGLRMVNGGSGIRKYG